MFFNHQKTQKIISLILLLAVFFPSFLLLEVKKTEAVADVIGGPSNIISSILKGIGNALTATGNVSQATTASTAVKTWYQEILGQILRAIARKALQEITKSTVNWINSGFHGNPLYIENSSSFFEDIAKSEVKNLVDMFGYDSLKYPFGKSFALNTINTYKSQLENNASYSLSNVVNDPTLLKNYQNNFKIFQGAYFHFKEMLPLHNAYPEEYFDFLLYGPAFSLIVAPFSQIYFHVDKILWVVFNRVNIILLNTTSCMDEKSPPV